MKPPVANPKDKLTAIFEHQREQMTAYHEIVEVNGFLFDHKIPVTNQTIEGEEMIRRTLLHFMEEIAEAQEVFTHKMGETDDREPYDLLHEELADALHFIVEVGILVGMKPREFCWWEIKPQEELLEAAFANRVDLDQSEVIEGEVYFLWPYYYSGLALNQLKNKIWKQKLKNSDMHVFRKRVRQIFASYITLCWSLNLNASQLFDWYMGKAKKNGERRESGY